MKDLGRKVLQAAQTVADRTGFDNPDAPVSPGDGAIGEVIHNRLKKIDKQFLQPMFGGRERTTSSQPEGLPEVRPDATPENIPEEDADAEEKDAGLDGSAEDAV